jgi:excinuclease ABC subunit A
VAADGQSFTGHFLKPMLEGREAKQPPKRAVRKTAAAKATSTKSTSKKATARKAPAKKSARRSA